ncbi:hypothetical protein FHX52_3519 [Humibacillus xanthopallidus]|uniref:Uncharacterized protein n=1 Tax=Humibacillus xanthopallidus TaxID=412689 RepID=A0A543PRU3_9MICO|nr:hypothetical protein [Humibacillus xanthopallidus]TQN46790.1 hypothetical protein FHX52_3519 [Humibacillus xanthopallidus]
MEPQIVAAILGPACTALLAATGIALKSLLEQRRSHGSRERDMRVAGETVVFIASYLAAYEKLNVAPAEEAAVKVRATNDLEASYQSMMAAAVDEQLSDSKPDWSKVVKATFLIPLERPAARVVRAIYYCALVYALAVSALYVSFSFTAEEAQGGRAVGLVSAIILLPFNVLPALLLHMWARRLERGAQAEANDLPATNRSGSWPVPSGQPLTRPPGA